MIDDDKLSSLDRVPMSGEHPQRLSPAFLNYDLLGRMARWSDERLAASLAGIT